jgi:hypothetical protein
MSFKITVLLVGIAASVHGQDFQNLNFEAATIPPSTPVGTLVPTLEALPGWTAYFTAGGTSYFQTQVDYDGISTGGGVISLVDAKAANPLQGNYSAYLFGGGHWFWSFCGICLNYPDRHRPCRHSIFDVRCLCFRNAFYRHAWRAKHKHEPVASLLKLLGVWRQHPLFICRAIGSIDFY